MLRFRADKFYELTTGVAVIRSRLRDGSIKGAPSLDVKRNFRDRLDALDELLVILQLPLSRKAVARTLACFSDSGDFDLKECIRCIDDLHSRVQDELEQSFLVCLPNSAREFYEPTQPLFGQAVDDAFPSASHDVVEAGKCYSLGRSTACVMHAMRALEPALTAMAKELGVSLRRDNWGEALQAIERALLTAPRSKREFFSEAAVQFRHFKDAWRNQAMHARVKYTLEEADVVMRAAKAFMQHLASELKE